jgi:hypothetical protein
LQTRSESEIRRYGCGAGGRGLTAWLRWWLVAEHELTKPQRNSVLEAILDEGLSPADFQWLEQLTEVSQHGKPPFLVQALLHEPTRAGFAFDLDMSYRHHYAVFYPGREGPTELINAGDWQTELSYVRVWLPLVKELHETPDLWAELEQQRDLMIGEAVENTPFTAVEQEQIAAQLTEAKEYVRANVELEPEQLNRIEAQLDYLVEAAKRSRRIDWRNLLVGSLLSLVMQAVLPAQPVVQLLYIVLRGLGHMFGGGAPELPAPPSELT